MADAVDGIDHARRTDQGIAASRHRRRPGVRLLAGDRDLVPALALRAGHHADRLARGFEDRPLLDMRLEIGGDRPRAHGLGAGKADPLELGAKGYPGDVVGACETLGEIEDPGEHP